MRAFEIVSRHLDAYAELLSTVAAETQAHFKRRVAWLLAGMVLGVSGLVGAWACLVLFLWDQPSRNNIAVLSAVALLVLGVLCGWLASRTGAPGPSRSRLLNELRLDRQLLDEWSQSR